EPVKLRKERNKKPPAKDQLYPKLTKIDNIPGA
ncbi:hypothetical protein L915_00542, partial [Phytophthora nicotianae]